MDNNNELIVSLKQQIAELINTNNKLVEENKNNELIILGLQAQIKKLENKEL